MSLLNWVTSWEVDGPDDPPALAAPDDVARLLSMSPYMVLSPSEANLL
jgi:hypothetical protein